MTHEQVNEKAQSASDEDLLASEERFHRLVDAITDYAIFMLDATGHVATWNVGAKRNKGYDAAEILGKHFSIFYTPEDRASGKPERVLDTVRRCGRFEEEGVRVRKDGTRYWANVVITALSNRAGEITGFAKVTRDLTERRAAEQQLRRSEARFQSMVDAVTDYAIFMLDSAGHVVTWNAGAIKTKGYEADEIVGRHFSVFYTPEDIAAGKPERVLDTVRREGRYEDEGFRVRKDGSRFWANVVVTALRSDGQVVGFTKVTRDLTARREAEQNELRLVREKLARAAAETERQRLLTLLQHVPAIVNFLRGPDLVFEFVHPKMSERLGDENLLGKPLALAAANFVDQRYCERVRRVYESGQPFMEDDALQWRSLDGQRVASYWSSVYLPLRDPATLSIEGVMTFELDVTQHVLARRALQEVSRENELARKELEKLNRAKDEFLATMSHELRTPLNAIYGWATILRRDQTDQAKLKRGLEVIERNARAQTRLVSDLLDVSRIISGKLQLKLAETELLPVIHSALDVVRPAADAKGVRLVVDVAPDTGTTMADPDRLHQVLWNLLVNAVRFTPRDGHIAVSAERLGSEIVLTVRDTGMGIGPEHLPHIFERFRQVDSSTTRAHGGLGLGLAIVRHLVEGHGGTAKAHSEGLGRGATSTITLPVPATEKAGCDGDDPQVASSRSSGPRIPQLSLRGISVLLVDDDPDSLEVLRMILEDAQAKVTKARSAFEALTSLESDGFDIIVSDIAMPEMDGYALMERVRSRARHLYVPAIALTAYARPEDAERAAKAGYQDHLAKPVDERRLLEAVSTLAHAQKQRLQA